MSTRRYLFLQGLTGPFFARLGGQLRRDGHAVYRIAFNTGDRLSWLGGGTSSYRQSLEALPDYLQDYLVRYGITDVVLVGDTRPVHQVALPVVRDSGARIHVLEEGYFRPSWLTLEQGGVNAHSSLPRDPDWYREAGRHVPEYGDRHPIPSPLRRLAIYEVLYRVPNALDAALYPHVPYHRPSALREFYGWSRRFMKMPWYERRAQQQIDQLIASGERFYVLPLQVAIDSQMRAHSDFSGIPDLVRQVINSFLRHAPADAHLLVKNHPLDTGLVSYGSWIRRLARRLGLADRIIYLEAGHMPTLLQHAEGVVTVNSTVGPSAMLHQRPVIALGDAIYDLPGLTFQGGLDAFWRDGEPPDQALFQAFRNTLIHTTQVHGGFYSEPGIEWGVQGCAAIMQRDLLPLEALIRQIDGG